MSSLILKQICNDQGAETSCVCVCTKRVFVKFTELVCKATRLAFSCQTSAISFPFIPVPRQKSL